MPLRRSIGVVGLMFIAVGGMVGSGWIFGPLLTAQAAGPASILSWIVGGAGMLILTLIFAENSTLFPLPGAVAVMPLLSMGRTAAAVVGWMAWVGYSTAAPIETLASLDYLAYFFHWIKEAGSPTGDLTPAGQALAVGILLFYLLLNAVGVAWFARVNTLVTWAKILIPLTLAGALIFLDFHPENFHAAGGFMPMGWNGVFAAVSGGGIVFSFIGFRHAIDMAAEVRNPQRALPTALTGALLIALMVYTAVQTAFVGAIDPAQLRGGWSVIDFPGHAGPLAVLIGGLGVGWLTVLLYAGAIAGPFGAALVATGSTARIVYSLANASLFPALFARLSRRGVPLEGLVLSFVLGIAVIFGLDFREAVSLNSATIVLSFSAGSISLLAFRRQYADRPRSFRLPYAVCFASAGFLLTGLIVYWSGFDVYLHMLGALLAGLGIFWGVALFRGEKAEDLDLRGALWLLPFVTGVGIIGYLGHFGGTGMLPGWTDNLLILLLTQSVLWIGVRASLDCRRSRRYYRMLTEREGLEASPRRERR